MLKRYREAAGIKTTMSSWSLVEGADYPLPPSSYLPLNAWELKKVCGRKPGKGYEGEFGWNVTMKVVLDGPNPLPLADSENRPTSPEPGGG